MSPSILHNNPIHGLIVGSQSRSSSPKNHHDTISSLKPIEEETLPKYNPDAFYPVKIDDVLNDRYKVVAKLGYGMTATVWLARDLHASPRKTKTGQNYVTIKININTLAEDFLKGRREISERLASGNPDHPGFSHVRFKLDTFKLKAPKGKLHLCIVYDVLREPIGICMEKMKSHLFTSNDLRKLVPALLKGLDYMHSECHVVHTDLKPDNIMMGLGDPAVLEKFVEDEKYHPSPRKTPDSKGRVIYQSRNDFGPAPSDCVIASAKITDIGLAEWGDEPQNKPIQSNAFTCPEVILAAGWSYPADIWNLGVMLWDLFETDGLFDDIDTRPGKYHSDQHLGLMIALLGPPPQSFLERGSTSATYFDENGKFRQPKLIPEDFSFEGSIKRMHGEDKELFIDFAKKMICWVPEERWTAKQLLDHPWLKLPHVENSSASTYSVGTEPPPSAPMSRVNTQTTEATSPGNSPISPHLGLQRQNTNSQALIDAILERKGR